MTFMGNLQPDDYGWALDSEGIPEMWMWVGGVKTAVYGEFDEVNSNKLVLLKCDPVDGKVKIKHDFGQIFGWDFHTEHGNLVWVSRNVFLITAYSHSNLYDNNPADGWTDDFRFETVKAIVHACRLDENGSTDPDNWTITKSVWKREILKEGYYGEGSTDPFASRQRYPGVPSGMTVVPSMSRPARDWSENGAIEKNILTITGSWPYFSTNVSADVTNFHEVSVHRMSSIPENVTNGIRENNDTYYAKDSAWTDGSDGENTEISAWKTVKNYGKPDYIWNSPSGCEYTHSYSNENKSDHEEGWCTCDSKGNFYYGNFDHWTGSDPITFKEYCNPSCANCDSNYFYIGGIARINATNGLNSSSSRSKLMFNREGTQGAGWGGLGTPPGNWDNAGQDADNPGIPYKHGEFSYSYYDQSHSLMSDGGACDIYGQSTSLLPAETSYTAKDTLFLLRQPNIGGGLTPITDQERDGMWIVKEKTPGSSVMQVLKRYSCYHQGSNSSPDSAIDDGGNGGWSCIGLDHNENGDIEGKALNIGMCFRPNSYK